MKLTLSQHSSLVLPPSCIPTDAWPPISSQSADCFNSREFYLPGRKALLFFHSPLYCSILPALLSFRLYAYISMGSNIYTENWPRISFIVGEIKKLSTQGKVHSSGGSEQRSMQQCRLTEWERVSLLVRPRVADAWSWEVSIFSSQELNFPNWNRRHP